MSTLVGHVGGVPDVVLSMDAISAFHLTASATATVAGDRLAVNVGDYLLGCQRDNAA